MTIRKAYADTTDGQVHYRHTKGGSGEPLIFFHMTSASSAGYVPILEQLAGKLPMIAFDTPNYGESYRTAREPSIAYIASALLEALDDLGIEKFHTFGHHTGVSIQCEMAAIAPDRVLSTIMNGPNYATMEQNAYLMTKLVVPNPISIKGTQFVAAWSRAKDNYPFSLWNNEDVQADIMNRETIDMLRAGPEWCWAYRAVFSHDLRKAMALVRCPKLFLCGSDDLAFDFHKQASADYPDAPSKETPGGIYAVESHAPEFAPHILAFIESLKTN